jgi:hypothetical protein
MNSYTLLWTNDTWDTYAKSSNAKISYVGGKSEHPFQDVKAGDEIFVVKVKAERLFVGGRLIARGAPVGKIEAKDLLPGISIIDKDVFVIADPSHLDIFRPNISLGASDVRSLEMIINGKIQHKTFTPTTFQQDFRNAQRISDSSALKLRALLSISPNYEEGDSELLDAALAESEEHGGIEEQTTLQAVKTRRGQPEFRSRLIAAYEGKCCFTGCDVAEVLEAAHIRAHSDETDYSVANGLLLRADIHTLFDLNLIAVDDRLRIRVSPELKASEYWPLDGQSLRLPARFSDSPSAQSLAFRGKRLLMSKMLG